MMNIKRQIILSLFALVWFRLDCEFTYRILENPENPKFAKLLYETFHKKKKSDVDYWLLRKFGLEFIWDNFGTNEEPLHRAEQAKILAFERTPEFKNLTKQDRLYLCTMLILHTLAIMLTKIWRGTEKQPNILWLKEMIETREDLTAAKLRAEFNELPFPPE